MSVSKMGPRGNPKCGGIIINMLGAELGGNTGENIKRVSWNNVREARDYSNAVPGIRSIVGRHVSGRGSMRKSRGRFRM
jgi:hypothetical protein